MAYKFPPQNTNKSQDYLLNKLVNDYENLYPDTILEILKANNWKESESINMLNALTRSSNNSLMFSSPNRKKKQRSRTRKNRINNLRHSELKEIFNSIIEVSNLVERINSFITARIRLIVIMRGCPGSGKSTMVKGILNCHLEDSIADENDHIFSTDEYFLKSNGQYIFRSSDLSVAHEWNKERVQKAATAGFSPIFIDNTNSQAWEMQAYAEIAIKNGYVLETLEPSTRWLYHAPTLAKRNSHGVPLESILRMLDRYEHNLTGQKLIKLFKLSYSQNMLPPQPAKNFNLKSNSVEDLNLSDLCDSLPMIESKSVEDPLQQLKKIPLKNMFDDKISNTNQSVSDTSVEQILKLFPSMDKDYVIEVLQCFKNNVDYATDYLIETGCEIQLSDNEKNDESNNNFENAINKDKFMQQLFIETNPSSSNGCNSWNSHGNIKNILQKTIENNCTSEYVLVNEDETLIFQKGNEETPHTLAEFQNWKTIDETQIFNGEFGTYNNEYVDNWIENLSVSNNCDDISLEPKVQRTKFAKKKNVFQQNGKFYSDSFTNTSYTDFNRMKNIKCDDYSKWKNAKILLGKSTNFQTGSPIKVFGLPFGSLYRMEDKELITEKLNKQNFKKANDLEELCCMFPSISYKEIVDLYVENENNISMVTFKLLQQGYIVSQIFNAEEFAKYLEEKSKEVIDNDLSTAAKNEFVWPEIPNEWTKNVSTDINKEISPSSDLYFGVTFRDATTNTNYKDFEALKELNLGLPNFCDKVIISNSYFISGLTLENRYINSCFDKSTMTMQYELKRVKLHESGLERLMKNFPEISRDNLCDLLDKCNCDIDWVVELLLDQGYQISTNFEPLNDNDYQNLSLSTDDEEDDYVEEITKFGACTLPVNKNINSSKKKRERMNSNELTEHIRNNFAFDDTLYSKQLKVQKQRYGPIPSNTNSTSFNTTADNCLFRPITDDISDTRETEQNDEDEETISVVFNKDFIIDLQKVFGSILPSSIIGENTIVNLPITLARQLHSFITDTVYQQQEEEEIYLKEMITKDAELARKLELCTEINPSQPSFMEIMDMELAQQIQCNENKWSRDGTADLMASKLSKQLLVERFPGLEQNSLTSILEDTNHSLYQATEILMAAGHRPQGPGIPGGPHVPLPISRSNDLTREEAVEQARIYREIANKFYTTRNEYYEKTKRAIHNKKYQVASYYSQMVKWQNDRINMANVFAASVLLNANSDSDTIDLHFLQVKEAIGILDIFIDSHVAQIGNSKDRRRYVYIITGRGVHSRGGPRIRPAVKAHLNKRNICFQSINPGMFSAEITRSAVMTTA